MRVLVIGGTHLSGPFLVSTLVDGGHEVFVCHRGEHEARLPPTVTHVRGDKADLHGGLGDDLRALRADVVVHMVALTRDDGRSLRDLRTERPPPLNVAEQYAYTEREWVERIAAAVGWGGEIVTQPVAEMPPRPFSGLDWRQSLVLDTTKIRDVLGYSEPVDPLVGVRRTVEWERANPP